MLQYSLLLIGNSKVTGHPALLLDKLVMTAHSGLWLWGTFFLPGRKAAIPGEGSVQPGRIPHLRLTERWAGRPTPRGPVLTTPRVTSTKQRV